MESNGYNEMLPNCYSCNDKYTLCQTYSNISCNEYYRDGQSLMKSF